MLRRERRSSFRSQPAKGTGRERDTRARAGSNCGYVAPSREGACVVLVACVRGVFARAFVLS